jgi:hypothetical protein
MGRKVVGTPANGRPRTPQLQGDAALLLQVEMAELAA